MGPYSFPHLVNQGNFPEFYDFYYSKVYFLNFCSLKVYYPKASFPKVYFTKSYFDFHLKTHSVAIHLCPMTT